MHAGVDWEGEPWKSAARIGVRQDDAENWQPDHVAARKQGSHSLRRRESRGCHLRCNLPVGRKQPRAAQRSAQQARRSIGRLCSLPINRERRRAWQSLNAAQKKGPRVAQTGATGFRSRDGPAPRTRPGNRRRNCRPQRWQSQSQRKPRLVSSQKSVSHKLRSRSPRTDSLCANSNNERINQ